jgi:multiple sugar transport system permease protein
VPAPLWSASAAGWTIATVLSVLFMLPAAVLLLAFLTYPLGLGVWLGFTDVKIGRPGVFIGLENYISLFLDGDRSCWLALFNTLFYTVVATVLKFGLGLWLALLLNNTCRSRPSARHRAAALDRAHRLSAIAFWWIYDAQFSIISWSADVLG